MKTSYVTVKTSDQEIKLEETRRTIEPKAGNTGSERRNRKKDRLKDEDGII